MPRPSSVHPMRALSAEEAALWERVTREVRAFRARPAVPQPVGSANAAVRPRPAEAGSITPVAHAPPRPRPGTTLDGTWDRRLARGEASPDVTIDLHGHRLQTAYEEVDEGLARAIAGGARLVLLITGRPPTRAAPPVQRGAIRAAVGDWLHASRHARHIAAVRGAAPRHGGAGALYIVLRRQ